MTVLPGEILGVAASVWENELACAFVLAGATPTVEQFTPLESGERVVAVYEALASLPEPWRRELARNLLLGAA